MERINMTQALKITTIIFLLATLFLVSLVTAYLFYVHRARAIVHQPAMITHRQPVRLYHRLPRPV